MTVRARCVSPERGVVSVWDHMRLSVGERVAAKALDVVCDKARDERYRGFVRHLVHE